MKDHTERPSDFDRIPNFPDQKRTDMTAFYPRRIVKEDGFLFVWDSFVEFLSNPGVDLIQKSENFKELF